MADMKYEAIFVFGTTKRKFKVLAAKRGKTFDELLNSLME
jgi:hypothetical protein